MMPEGNILLAQFDKFFFQLYPNPIQTHAHGIQTAKGYATEGIKAIVPRLNPAHLFGVLVDTVNQATTKLGRMRKGFRHNISLPAVVIAITPFLSHGLPFYFLIPECDFEKGIAIFTSPFKIASGSNRNISLKPNFVSTGRTIDIHGLPFSSLLIISWHLIPKPFLTDDFCVINHWGPLAAPRRLAIIIPQNAPMNIPIININMATPLK
jgi:hypothetical protein